MKFGIFLQPVHHPSTDPTEALDADLALVEDLDAMGFDEVWVGEHHSTGWENIASPEAFIAAAAQRTEQIRFGTGVLQMGIHHPLVALDRMIFLDHLTRGRVSFGMGVGGGLPSDLRVVGLTPEEAGVRLQESFQAIVALLSADEPVDMKTDWFELAEAELQLRPYSEPHMEFAMATANPANVELMGRHGGLILLGSMPGAVNSLMAHLEDGAKAAGRSADRSQFRLSYRMHIADSTEEALDQVRDGFITEMYDFNVAVNGRREPDGTPEEWFAEYAREALIGSPDAVADRIEEIVEAAGGVGGILFTPRDWAGEDATRRSWQLFAEKVAPRFR